MSFFMGAQSFVTGVERLDDGALKVYVGQRGRNVYTIIDDERDAREVERAWSDRSAHVLIPTPPPECLYRDPPPLPLEEGHSE